MKRYLVCARRLPLGVPSRLRQPGTGGRAGSDQGAGQPAGSRAGLRAGGGLHAIMGALCASGALDADKVPLAQGVVALVVQSLGL